MSLSSESKLSVTIEPWRICEAHFDAHNNYLNETLFSVGNGTIGLRGTHEETYLSEIGSSQEGAYVNGFYEFEPIHYPETAYGLARVNEFMLNLPNAKGITLWVEGEAFNLLHGEVKSYQRDLDFRTGILTRKVVWQSPKGHQLEISTQRLVSFEIEALFAIHYVVKSLNFEGELIVQSSIDGGVNNLMQSDDPRVGSTQTANPLKCVGQFCQDAFAALIQETNNSGFRLVSAAIVDAATWTKIAALPLLNAASQASQSDKNSVTINSYFATKIAVGETVQLTKFGSYISSRDYPSDDLIDMAMVVLIKGQQTGFAQLCASQKAYLDNFWAHADIQIEGAPALQQGIRFNQFQLLQSVSRNGKNNIAAKGLSGEGYEGHYFWDTEIYILPFFLFNQPVIAKKLLEYRINGLPKARLRARQMAHPRGALFPWRTISGEECSAYFPAGTAQYHINADIAYAFKLYFEATNDVQLFANGAAELVWETARIWLDIGHFSAQHNGQFCINEVTGPDEYTALVNNNYYTNLMAQMHFEFAVALVDLLAQNFPEKYQQIVRQIELNASEIADWKNAAAKMFLPFDERLQIHAQDDSFLSKKRWDIVNTPADKFPLLLHFHPLVIYRHQVCKQADLLLAMQLLSNKFTLSEKKNNFDYYEKVTTHDSSLSSCIFSVIASEIGYYDKAYDYFMQTARTDLDNLHGNTQHGLHTAAMAGTWMGIVVGFAGMRLIDGALIFKPTLPAEWQSYQFQLQLKSCRLAVKVEKTCVTYHLLQGAFLTLQHDDVTVELTPEFPHQNRSLLVINNSTLKEGY